ncbi:hypothetical protein FB451DRAFT_1222870 [Mycena latifolia]|nr:hypothetical protein FB451DRAFT_1222870 [Mycena latifolia]
MLLGFLLGLTTPSLRSLALQLVAPFVTLARARGGVAAGGGGVDATLVWTADAGETLGSRFWCLRRCRRRRRRRRSSSPPLMGPASPGGRACARA